MVDENKIIVLGSLSLRASIQTRTTTTTNDVMRACSLRASLSRKTNAASDDVLDYASAAIAGYVHNGGEWTDPKNLKYVVIHV